MCSAFVAKVVVLKLPISLLQIVLFPRVATSSGYVSIFPVRVFSIPFDLNTDNV